jgi:hypothetical protein
MGTFLLGVLFHMFREQVSQVVGSSVAGLSYLPVATLCVLARNPPKAIRESKFVLGSLLLAGCAVQLILASRRDSKMELMFAFFPWIVWLASRRMFGALLGSTFALAAAYLIVIAPIVTAVRDLSTINDQGRRSILDSDATGRVALDAGEGFSSNRADYLNTWIDVTLNRLSDPIAAGQVAILAHESGFLRGESWQYIVTNFVPRIFWPDKPNVDRGRTFTARLGWASDASVATTSTGETSAGEFYWNFGWPGVLLGMFVLGSIFSSFWWAAAGPEPAIGTLEMTAFVSATLSFVTGTGAAAGPVFVGCISMGLLFRVLIRLKQWSSKVGRRGMRSVGKTASCPVVTSA